MPLEFTKLEQPLIIATKGLPCTAKSEFARIIGQWAKCPVLYIDHFLDTLSLEKGYTTELMPSPEQAERLHRLSFDALCKAASDTLQWGVDNHVSNTRKCKCIVVKSRLCSNFELNRLLQLARGLGCGMILIIEFRMKNEYRYRLRLDNKVESRRQKEWYKPRSWKDIEKAKDDYEAAHNNWDLHLRRLVNTGDGLSWVTRLVLDPFDDLFLVPIPNVTNLSQCVINFLIRRVEVGLEGRYATVQFKEVGRYLREKELKGPRFIIHNHEYLCYACSMRCYCIIKHGEELMISTHTYNCAVCKELVLSRQPVYGCHFCTLTLHKSCAMLGEDFALEGYQDIEILRHYPNFLPQQHACKSCLVQGKRFSKGCDSCKFETHLKCRVLPTILSHDCHDHFLFMFVGTKYKCSACGIDRREFGGCYFCYVCDKNYDLGCLSLVREGEHKHGGHQHLLNLMYTRDGTREEEAYWCDICYKDMDPQNWFYSCQQCPYFSAHPNCVRHSIRTGSLQSHPKAPR